MTHENSKKVQEPFGDYVLSMFMKGFMLITIPGCFADVCNTIFAVRGKEESSNIETTEAVIDDFINDVIKKCNYSELWIPTHVAHDAEKDDELSLVLLEYLNVCKHQHDRVPSISQLAQIPAYEIFRPLCSKFDNVFFDAGARNMQALSKHHHLEFWPQDDACLDQAGQETSRAACTDRSRSPLSPSQNTNNPRGPFLWLCEQ